MPTNKRRSTDQCQFATNNKLFSGRPSSNKVCVSWRGHIRVDCHRLGRIQPRLLCCNKLCSCNSFDSWHSLQAEGVSATQMSTCGFLSGGHLLHLPSPSCTQNERHDSQDAEQEYLSKRPK